MTSVPAPGLDPDELARLLARLSPEELREFLVLVNAERNSAAHFSGEGTLSAGAPAQGDLLSRVTATITTSWSVEAPEAVAAGDAEATPEGSASGTTAWTGSARGTAPRVKSPAVAAVWQYLKKVSPQDNTQFLATLEAVLKVVLVVWLMTGPTGVASDLLEAVQRELGETVVSVLEHLDDIGGTHESPRLDSGEPKS